MMDGKTRELSDEEIYTQVREHWDALTTAGWKMSLESYRREYLKICQSLRVESSSAAE